MEISTSLNEYASILPGYDHSPNLHWLLHADTASHRTVLAKNVRQNSKNAWRKALLYGRMKLAEWDASLVSPIPHGPFQY